MKRVFFFLLTFALVSCSKDIAIDEYIPVPANSFKVTRKGNNVSVVRHYVKNYDFELLLGPCGINQLVQIKKLTYIPNSSSEISSPGKPGPNYVSYSDWIGPCWMEALERGNGNSGFTGGWHGSDGDVGGGPTARCVSVSVFVDGQQLDTDVHDMRCRDVLVVVENHLQAGNTKQSDGNGREVLSETVNYHFHADTLSVSVAFKPLEDIVIQNYYGLQSCFGGTVRMACRDTIYTFLNDGYHGAPRRVSIAECTRDDGHQVRCVLDSIGLGRQIGYNLTPSEPERQFCFTSPYGKTYFRLVGEAFLPLYRGQSAFWSGAYIFREAPR